MTRLCLVALGIAMPGLLGCTVPQEQVEVEEEPLILAEPMAVEPAEPCTGDEDDGIGGTGCQPVVAKQALSISE